MFRWLGKLISRRYIKEQLGHPSGLQYWIGKLFYGATGDAPSHGIEVTEDSALTYSAYWRAINIISDAVACLPLKVYRYVSDGKEENWQHPVQRLLAYQPNRYMDARVCRKTMQAHAVGYGNGYGEIERNGRGDPIAIWPLLPDRTTPRLIGTGSDQELFYETRHDGQAIMIPSNDILHIMGLGFDGIKGYSLISYAAWSLGVGMAADRYTADFFGNDATPSGAVKVPEALNKKSVEELKRAWEEQRRASGNKHRMAVLHSGMEWEQFAINAHDAQLIESRKFSIAEVARWAGIPPHMLGDMEYSKYNNVEHLGIEFRTYGLLTWFKAWELQCTLKLFPDTASEFVEFLVDAYLRADTKTRYEAYAIGRNWGWLTVNNILAKENMNGIGPEGDTRLQPLNMTGIGDIGKDNNARVALDHRWVNSVDLLEQTWGRIVTKETRALATAISEGVGGIERCYDKLSVHVESVLWPVARSVFGDNAEARLGHLVTQYLQEHRRAVLDVMTKSGNGDNRDRISELTRPWIEDCPTRMARLTVKGYLNA